MGIFGSKSPLEKIERDIRKKEGEIKDTEYQIIRWQNKTIPNLQKNPGRGDIKEAEEFVKKKLSDLERLKSELEELKTERASILSSKEGSKAA